MEFFGEPWDAPICDPDDETSVPQAPTPVGRPCFAHACSELIKGGDQGVLIPFHPFDGEPRLEPWHRKCFLREILGPHAHLDGFLKN
jgi:hypothetical protein